MTGLMASPQDTASPYAAFYYCNAPTVALDAVRYFDHWSRAMKIHHVLLYRFKPLSIVSKYMG